MLIRHLGVYARPELGGKTVTYVTCARKMTDDTKTIDQSTGNPPNHGKKGRGNKWSPDPEQHRQMKAMAAMGMTPAEIGKVVGVSAPTIRRVCKADPELFAVDIQTDAKVAASLFKMATRERNPVPAAAIFWMKARRGWSDRPDSERETPAKKAARREAAQRVGGSGRLAPGKGPAKLSVVK